MILKINKTIIPWLPSFVWMLVIFYFSSIPTAGVISSNPIERFYIYKSFHLIEYAFLCILLIYASKNIKTSILLAYLYSCTDEIHQFFTPGRTCKFTDTLIDLIGILLGLMVLKIFQKLYPDTFKRIVNRL
jgi:VanZ family protein